MANILLAGFDRDTASEFGLKLAQFGHLVRCQSFESRSSELSEAEVVFLSGDDVRWRRYLQFEQAGPGRRPVIIAGRIAEDYRWLAALEAGATDYCSLDIGSAHLKWIVENATKRGTFSSAAA